MPPTCVQVLLLAVCGTIVAQILLALVARFIFPYQWDWGRALLFGAVLSAIDPVAVVAVLQEVREQGGVGWC